MDNTKMWGSDWFPPALGAFAASVLALVIAIPLRAEWFEGSFGSILSDVEGGLIGIAWFLGILTLVVAAFAIIRRQDEQVDRFGPLASKGQWMAIGAMTLAVIASAVAGG